MNHDPMVVLSALLSFKLAVLPASFEWEMSGFEEATYELLTS